jgi:hypothetical protein
MTVGAGMSRYNMKIDSSTSWKLVNTLDNDIHVEIMPRNKYNSVPYDTSRTIYAVSFVMVDRKFDKVKQEIETQLQRKFNKILLTSVYYSKTVFYRINLDSSCDLLIQQYYNNTKPTRMTTRVSFCYKLSEEEINLFVLRQGYIKEDD